MHKNVYLDYNASTPIDPRVFAKMKPYFEEYYGNPASQLHQKGWDAKAAVEQARKNVADLIGAQPEEIVFTGGATESNNWALKGLIDFFKYQNPDAPLHVLTSNVEHASVREPLLDLQRKKIIEADFIPVDNEGFITVADLEKHRKPHTRLLSLIWIHNEIGTIQNLKEIALWAEKNNIYLHTDGTQAIGKISVNVQEIPITFLSFSGHKLYGPKGIGALFIRKTKPEIKLSPLLHGGGQETLGRSGTMNVPGIVGLGEACALAKNEMKQDWEKIKNLMENFWLQIKTEFPQINLNGPALGIRTVYNLNITIPGVQGSDLLPLIPDLCLSGGSACSSGNLQGNPVLLAIGHSPDDASVSLRISAGRMTSDEDFNRAFSSLSKALKSLGFANSKEGSHGLTTMLK